MEQAQRFHHPPPAGYRSTSLPSRLIGSIITATVGALVVLVVVGLIKKA